MRKTMPTCLAVAMAVLPTAAWAHLPSATRAMIDAAIATGDPAKVATVIELAQTVHPEHANELTVIARNYAERRAAMTRREKATARQAIMQAGLFDNWEGEGQIGAFRNTGNSSNVGFNAGLKLRRIGIDWRHRLAARIDYQRANGRTSREQALFGYEPSYDINGALYSYGLVQYERDRRQGFSSRYSVSSGIGYRVIESDRMNLEIKTGPAWRRTERITGETENRFAGLAGLDFDWQLAEAIALTQDASAYVQSGNSSFIATTGIEAGITGSLKARLSYSVEHDTDPPGDAVKTDTLSRFTLVYGF